MEEKQKKYTELANQIYDLDGEVYESVRSLLAVLLPEGEKRLSVP